MADQITRGSVRSTYTLACALTCALLLTACGGGGGGGDNNTSGTGSQPGLGSNPVDDDDTGSDTGSDTGTDPDNDTGSDTDSGSDNGSDTDNGTGTDPGSDPDSGGVVVNNITIEGVAGKGLLDGATVQVITSGGTVIGETVTDEKGAFSLEVSGEYQGQVLVEVTSPEGGDSLMQCDLRNCGTATDAQNDSDSDGMIRLGEWLPLEASLTLRAITDLAEGTNHVAVNYGTHAAAVCADAGRDLGATLQDLTDILRLSVAVEERDIVEVSSASDPTELSESLLIAALLTSIAGSDGTLQERMENADSLLSDDCDAVIEGLSTTELSTLALQTLHSISDPSNFAETEEKLNTINTDASKSEVEISYSGLSPLPPQF